MTNYYILKADLDDHFHNFEVDYDSKELDHYFNANKFFSPDFSSDGWKTVELHEFKEYEEYLPVEDGKVIRPSLWPNIMHVWGAPTFVFSQALKNDLSGILGNCGYFLEAEYHGEPWYFYYCNVHLSNALDLKLSEYDVFEDGRIMSLHTAVLVRDVIKNTDIFRASEYTNRLFVSDRVKAIIDKHFVGNVFKLVEIV
ncbi:hypothetical protein KPY62_01695 [Psychrobacter sp. TAE2020]|uniref:imm11 family protein n=1 Tax=Psychrobacter sp. TAE2020 TaxID=2846762 RepID=UPI001C109AB1|nr:DUF1629 domain-containing protein [Psychrobacter sp. TAE2020]MBU5615833.1 hypothetical protein [Psychrobacter sp. TAE2020]